jgi:hypothetical protein
VTAVAVAVSGFGTGASGRNEALVVKAVEEEFSNGRSNKQRKNNMAIAIPAFFCPVTLASGGG